jgi:methionyl-tRNA formyltransferase
VCIMQMEAGLDTGPVRLRHELAIGADESGGSLHDRLAQLGATSIVEALSLLERDALPMHPQPDEGVTYATKIGRADSMLDFTQSAQSLVDRIRALDPAPGCVAALSHSPQTMIKVWAARPVALPAHPEAAAAQAGTGLAVDAEAITVACGSAAKPQAIAMLELQRPGGRRMPARAFLSGFALRPGDRLCAPMAAADPSSA